MRKYSGNQIVSVRLDGVQIGILKNYCKITSQKRSKVIRNAIIQYVKAGSILHSVLHSANSPANFNGDGI